MKKLIKPLVVFALALGARGVVRKYKPTIVMVTGSVGKTSTKDAVAAALSARYYLRKSEKNLNTEFGVPFTIFGESTRWSNPIGWLRVFKTMFALLLLPNHYPKLLVLEVGADKPGDLTKILRIVTPHVVVVTRLPEIPVHVEAYTSPEAVREEEFAPAYALPANAPLIVAADDLYAVEMSVRTPARVLTYGVADDAQVMLTNPACFEENGQLVGMKAEVNIEGTAHALEVRGSVGRTQLLPMAAALATAHALEVPLIEAIEALADYEPPAGRGRLLSGVNNSLIVDDSYNSSPAAVEEALRTLAALPYAKRRIAVLGDMLELGRYSVMEHERIGGLARATADLVIAVGVRAKAFIAGEGGSEVLQFDNSAVAGPEIAKLLEPGDIVLVKGSQSIRMERVVEALLADPADASRLVRQEREWKRRN